MNFRTVIFLVSLFFITGIVIGFSSRKPIVKNVPVTSTVTIRDTIVKVKNDTIKIPVDKIKYFTKTDTIIVKDNKADIKPLHCVTFPLLLSDSSLISVTECSKENIPKDLTFDAMYLDKRETIRTIQTKVVDTVIQYKTKRLGFSIGPSAGVGIDVNDIRQPVYFIGATLTYGIRF